MFPQIRNEAERLETFCHIVSSMNLPRGTKRQHENQLTELQRLMELWVLDELYDSDLDPFLQFLRFLIGDGTLADLLVILSNDANAELARQLARDLEHQGRIGLFPARELPEEAKVSLRELKNHMTDRGAYTLSRGAVPTCSSGESSESEMEEDFAL